MTLHNMMAGWYIYTDRIPHVLLALLILLVGWLVAKAVGKAVEKALRKTNLDNKLFSNVGKRKYASEVIIGKMVYYLLVVVVLIFFFNMLHLNIIAEPLVEMVSTLTSAIPNLLKAALILVVAWVIAYFARMLFKKGAAMLHLEQRLVKWKMTDKEANAAVKVNGIAQAIFYLVMLLFLPAVLGALHLEGISEPFSHALSTMLGLIPKLFAAALIVFIGWLLAKIIRDILTNFLKSIGADRLGERVGLEKADLSTIIGNIVFILILIPTIITALEKLDLKGILEPAIAMLHQIMTLIPNIVAAVLLILFGIWLGKWIEKMVAQMLWRLRFDNIFHHMGIGSLTPEQSKYTLSQLVGLLAKIVVVLLFTSEALQIVHLDFLVTLATGVLAYLPMVVAALVILGIGLYLGHLVERVLQNVLKQRYSRTLAAIAKYAIFTITLFMALDQLGVAHSIVNAAFILVLGGLALAFGLAFGLGGKEFAAKYLGKLDEKIEEENV
ncbi:putative integral inner membrane protein [Neobacillus bataviensis LMG 21833]|uniref:Putative integral inner membrane protein n=1 Tax=Neobacillus bataviensis LMG 21833 TaxID=1117379 RepID=K6C637_9BACI|nr:mechanosensitive ion channel [Neobacillus bataviensis]EKN66570.1 putative integral inner membrane protein [Neobacillus bataviensis LMG 21833]